MDPAITVALVSVLTAAVTTAGGVAVAVLTNKKEAENSAEDARMLTLQERITLRDEQIVALRAENDRLRAENKRLRGREHDAEQQ